MASELYVETLKGLTSGANANKVIIPSGQTLDASAGTFTPSAGQVVQTVYDTLSSDFSNATTSLADTGLAVTITPKHSNSILIVEFTGPIHATASNSSGTSMVGKISIYNASNSRYHNGDYLFGAQPVSASLSARFFTHFGVRYIHSPGSTSSQTFKIYAASNGGNTSFKIEPSYTGPAYLIVQEIKQ